MTQAEQDARNAALDEAAKIADDHYLDWDETISSSAVLIAKEIRALKTAPESSA